ncbi:site-specific integrase [Massilimicrobiota sp. SW1139]|nr:site-specific integrase [Massilimicrobiota sp. SW1139]
MMKLIDIRGIHIQKLFNELSIRGYSYGTLSLLKSLLNEMFKKAIGNGLAIINPCDSVVLPKNEKKESRYLTEREQVMFLKVAKDYAHYDIFLANLSSGLRIGELLGLKWEDVNFDEKTINIERTLHYSRLNDNEVCHFFFTSPKTGTSIRKIPLLPETEATLKIVKEKQIKNKILYANKWKQEEPFIDMVFTTQFGKPIRYGDVNRTIKTVVMKANMIEKEIAKRECREPFLLRPFSPHCFRHTFVTRCKKYGVSYETIQPYVGHNNKEMTEYYNHNVPEMDIEGLKK